MKYIVNWSGGKDSTCTIILAHLMNLPLDEILFSEVMFNETISGELPEHIQFIKKCIPVFMSWGYKVTILHHSKTYMDYFNQIRVQGKNIGKKVGFPMADRCNVRNCKIEPIKKYLKEVGEDTIQYIGYAADEPLRLSRLTDTKVSILAQYGYTEMMARKLCEEYHLLSPYYAFSKRGGCWFCPNAALCQLRNTRKNYPKLWKMLLQLETQENLVGQIWNTRTHTSIHDMDTRLLREEEWESRQYRFDFSNGKIV